MAARPNHVRACWMGGLRAADDDFVRNRLQQSCEAGRTRDIATDMANAAVASTGRTPGCYACYLLRSESRPAATYIGFTVDPHRRLRQHNGATTNGAKRTSRNRPWSMLCSVFGFPSKLAALQFEWAWQHPLRTRSLRAADSAAIRGTGYMSRLSALRVLLQSAPWVRMPLAVLCRDSGIAARLQAAVEPDAQHRMDRRLSALADASASLSLDLVLLRLSQQVIPVLVPAPAAILASSASPSSSAVAAVNNVGPSSKAVVRSLAASWRGAAAAVSRSEAPKCSYCTQGRHDIAGRWARCCSVECPAVFHVRCAAREALASGQLIPVAIDCQRCMSRMSWSAVVGQHMPSCRPAARPSKREAAVAVEEAAADEETDGDKPKRAEPKPAVTGKRRRGREHVAASPSVAAEDAVVDLISP